MGRQTIAPFVVFSSIFQIPTTAIFLSPWSKLNVFRGRGESMKKQQDHFARHGGVHFTNNVSPEEINDFVDSLPEDRKESMFEVLQELRDEGMIDIVDDHVFTDGEGKIGGSDDC